MKTLLERFMEHVRSDWQWTAYKNRKGYGVIGIGGKRTALAHRVSYELFNGPIPEGALVLHSCDDPGCVNPDHLHVGDNSMNIREAYERGLEVPFFGEKNGMAKLTCEQVIKIRAMVADGQYHRSVAKQFGIGHAQVTRIVNRKNWKHI